jgi:hypothetical protein
MNVNSNMDVAREPRISFQRRRGIARDRSASAGEVLNIGLTNIVFLAAHIPLGLLLHSSSLVGALHGFGTFAVGMYLALFDRRLERVAYVGGYIIGAEVLWHMTDAPIFWEFGKYSISAIFITAIIRNRLIRAPALPVLYFVLLVPSVLITLIQEDWESRSADLIGGRDMISFNMSGPLALVVSAWFLSHLKLSTIRLQWLFLAVLAPIVSISTIALLSVASSSNLNFGGSSNLTASGNFGPNQVSSILGLGAILAFLFYILSNRVTQSRKAPISGVIGWLRRFLMICLMILFIAQSALTFSRGGLYNTIVGLVMAYFYLVRESRSRLQFVFIALFLVGFSTYVLLPKLNDFTGGAFASRFENTSATGREEMIGYQLAVFKYHILFGVGPGRGSAFSSHTEYTRLLADHGLLGIVALLVLFIIVALNIKRARTTMNKAIVASLLAWSFAFMAHVGMRLAAPSFMIGVTFATLMLQENKTSKAMRRRIYKKTAPTNIPLPVLASRDLVEHQ